MMVVVQQQCEVDGGGFQCLQLCEVGGVGGCVDQQLDEQCFGECGDYVGDELWFVVGYVLQLCVDYVDEWFVEYYCDCEVCEYCVDQWVEGVCGDCDLGCGECGG